MSSSSPLCSPARISCTTRGGNLPVFFKGVAKPDPSPTSLIESFMASSMIRLPMESLAISIESTSWMPLFNSMESVLVNRAITAFWCNLPKMGIWSRMRSHIHRPRSVFTQAETIAKIVSRPIPTSHQNCLIKLVIKMSARVAQGRASSIPLKTPITFGITKDIRKMRMMLLIMSRKSGYVIAASTFFFSFILFSEKSDNRFRMISRAPPVSPAMTIFT